SRRLAASFWVPNTIGLPWAFERERSATRLSVDHSFPFHLELGITPIHGPGPEISAGGLISRTCCTRGRSDPVPPATRAKTSTQGRGLSARGHRFLNAKCPTKRQRDFGMRRQIGRRFRCLHDQQTNAHLRILVSRLP